ncbi:hypothetical protein REPUB_Repub08aG0086600 [Reevesia pubescens]
MPERQRLEFWVWSCGECCKLEVLFDDILETVVSSLKGSACNALLFRVRYAPRIYQKVSGPNLASRFNADRYHMFKESSDFLWVRTTHFSKIKSIGRSTSFYWEFNAGLSMSDMFICFPCFREDMRDTFLEGGEEFSSASEIVPLVKGPSDSKLAYEILFQLNSLVHTQKVSIATVDTDLIHILSVLPVETALMILQKFHKLKAPCYNHVSFVKTKLPVTERNFKSLPLSSFKRILSVLQNGIVIGDKQFEFLAFSASQLRSNSVWMFASNEKDVEIIPDIEVNSDGIDYCFSDGIGKISLPFARQVAQKCGLDHTPSAFQIRYGGYKSVVVVRNSFRKMSLRSSMLKFESKIRMLNVKLECADQSFFHKLDEDKAIVIGKIVVTKNPCLHPGDVRVLEAVYEALLEEKDLVDCLVFPQKGKSWDKDLIPCQTDASMDYTGPRPRIMDHEVTLQEIQKFFVDCMNNDTLGAISTAHLVHADRESDKARSANCLALATLHSMAVDFAKSGAPAEMHRALKPREFPDFMQRGDKPMYTSFGVLGKTVPCYSQLNRASKVKVSLVKEDGEIAYDHDLEVNGFEAFLRYGEMKERIVLSFKNLQREAKEWFKNSCKADEHQKLASAWYHATYHPNYFKKA